jgi:hypothetical protein
VGLNIGDDQIAQGFGYSRRPAKPFLKTGSGLVQQHSKSVDRCETLALRAMAMIGVTSGT